MKFLKNKEFSDISRKPSIKTEHQLNLERVEFLLNQALDYDEEGCINEAISLYSEAVELCLKAVSYRLISLISLHN